MTTEDLIQPPVAISKPVDAAVAALKNKYTQEGWILLSDGCPDCDTWLMRNQEATSQVCVNCKINPPVDPEEEELPKPSSPKEQEQEPQQQQQSQPNDQNPESPKSPVPQDLDNRDEPDKASIPPPMDLPGPTSTLPPTPVPSPIQLLSPTNRVSVLDPMLDAVRKSYRSPSGRLIGGTGAFPSGDLPRPPPPRSVTPLPMPPKSSPPIRPPGALSLNVTAPLSPPFPPSAPKIMPRDKRRSPQPSVVVQGNANLPPPPVAPKPRAPSRTALPTPPSSAAIVVGPESTVADGQGSEVDIAQNHRPAAHRPTQAAEKEEEKGLESHDEYEDADEMAFRSKEGSTTVHARESQLELNERVSRLMGQKMQQGWAMLQETCPNPACNGVPLMRSREKKECCVGCGNNYDKNSTQPSPSGATAVKPSESASRTTRAAAGNPSQHRITSPLTGPISSRSMRELCGRISSPIVLPPPTPMSPSFGMTSQQIMSRFHTEEFKLACEDEEMKKHMQLIGKVGDFSTRSLPPVPAMSPTPTSASTSRPTSTYSNTSDREKQYRYYPFLPSHSHPHHSHQQHQARSENAPPASPSPASPRVPASPEVHALIDATYKTMSTLLSKLEACRLALEVSESPKETQALTNQIKGLMECLKACREVL